METRSRPYGRIYTLRCIDSIVINIDLASTYIEGTITSDHMLGVVSVGDINQSPFVDKLAAQHRQADALRTGVENMSRRE